MQLTTFFVVFVALVGRICWSKIVIGTSKSDGLAEVEDAATNLLANCYAHQDKTIVLIGDIPGSFVKKLSSRHIFSIVSLNNERQVHNGSFSWTDNNFNKAHNVHILVIMVPYYRLLEKTLWTFSDSRYRRTATFALILGWSPQNKYAGCAGNKWTFLTFVHAHKNNLLHPNLICRDITKGIVIYGSSAFANHAPEPWQFISTRRSHHLHIDISTFIREYREHDEMCENLFFEKMLNMHGSTIKTVNRCHDRTSCLERVRKNEFAEKLVWFETAHRYDFIRDFLIYMNATEKPIRQEVIVGQVAETDDYSILTESVHIRGLPLRVSYAYPYGTDCKFIVTQSRGHKSQVQKIRDVIDMYSWGGMYVVYLITLLFFKFFLHQPWLVGILNLCRMTSNLEIIVSPVNVATKIYLGCLLFFMVTMQGIFTSSLASVMAYNVSVQQVQSIEDLADLGYTVYVSKYDIMHFSDPKFTDRLIVLLANDECIQYVLSDASIACLTWGAWAKSEALYSELHVSRDCIKTEYISIILPTHWILQEQFNKFVGIQQSTGIMVTFDVLVEEKRFLEAELEEKIPDPKIMTLTDFGFAFVIFGIGLVCAFVSFIAEVMIYRFQHRITTTRVIRLN